MKRSLLFAVTVSLFILVISPLGICENGRFGIGIISGEPTGVSGKLWTGANNAVDGAVAWSFAEDFHLHLHADWLYHNWTYLKDKFGVEQGEIPLYYGIGGRIRFDDDPRVGARFVLGLAYIWDNAPFDVFLEVAPVLDVAPKTEVNGNIAVGVRYWFK